MDDSLQNIQRAYLDQRKALTDGEIAQSSLFDKSILASVGTAFAVSIAFLHDISGDSIPSMVGFLILAWASFSVAITSTLASIVLGQRAHEQYRDILDRHMAKGRTSALDTARAEMGQRWEPKWIGALNWVAMGAFLLGMIGLCVFTSFNLL